MVSRSLTCDGCGSAFSTEYLRHFILKRITNAGTFRFKRHLLSIANALKQRPVGLKLLRLGFLQHSFIDARHESRRLNCKKPLVVELVRDELCGPPLVEPR